MTYPGGCTRFSFSLDTRPRAGLVQQEDRRALWQPASAGRRVADGTGSHGLD